VVGAARRRGFALGLVALAITGCGSTPATPPVGSPAGPTGTPRPAVTLAAVPAPVSAAPSASPEPAATQAVDCPADPDWVGLADPASGVSLVMPKGWHQMQPGDPVWQTIWGEDGSPVEAELENGATQAFAIPLDTPDARLLSLVVYVRTASVGDLVTLGEAYADVMRTFVVDDFDAAVVGDGEVVSLPAGDAYRIEAAMRYSGLATPKPDLPTRDERMLAYVLLREGRSTYLVFRGNDHIFGHHLDAMACMAQSLRLSEPAPVASATP